MQGMNHECFWHKNRRNFQNWNLEKLVKAHGVCVSPFFFNTLVRYTSLRTHLNNSSENKNIFWLFGFSVNFSVGVRYLLAPHCGWAAGFPGSEGPSSRPCGWTEWTGCRLPRRRPARCPLLRGRSHWTSHCLYSRLGWWANQVDQGQTRDEEKRTCRAVLQED